MSEIELLESQVMSLPLSDRARLADRLLGSLWGEFDPTWAATLDEEITFRIESRKRSEVPVYDGNASLKRMWSLLEQ